MFRTSFEGEKVLLADERAVVVVEHVRKEEGPKFGGQERPGISIGGDRLWQLVRFSKSCMPPRII